MFYQASISGKKSLNLILGGSNHFSRPALIVENIPGLELIGNQKKPNPKIRVEHILEVKDLLKFFFVFLSYFSLKMMTASKICQ